MLFLVAFPVIPPGIWREVTYQVIDPVGKPAVYSHLPVNEYNTVLVLILSIRKPVSGFRQGIKMPFVAFAISGAKACCIFSVLSLADAFPTFSAF